MMWITSNDVDHLTRVLTRITCHLIAYRFALENERVERRKQMAIEIKGLKLKAMTARSNLDDLGKAYDAFNEMAPAHAAEVRGMAEQITEMQTDLEFATSLMGNSGGGSSGGEGGKEPDRPKATEEPPETQQTPVPPKVMPALETIDLRPGALNRVGYDRMG